MEEVKIKENKQRLKRLIHAVLNGNVNEQTWVRQTEDAIKKGIYLKMDLPHIVAFDMSNNNIEIAEKEMGKLENNLKEILPCLAYKGEYYRDGPFHKIKVDYINHMINKKTGLVLTGLVPRIKEFCKLNNIPMKMLI